MMRAAIMAVAFIPLLSLSAGGQEPDGTGKTNLTSAFESFGFHEERQLDGGKCIIKGELNQKKFLESVPVLKKLGILNSELPESAVNTKPYTLSSAFLIAVIPLETKNFYENNENADKCSFNDGLLVVDDYGNNAKVPAMSYKFNRALFKKINWEQFDSTKALKVFPSFELAPSLVTKMSEERVNDN